MALFDISNLTSGGPVTGKSLMRAQRTSFAGQGIQERVHLQAALRDRIEILDDGLLVVSEEFGDFEGVSRRIDLLCLDRSCRLVVVELKRTADGGHMELQALRYAAMVSTMSFAQVVEAFTRYRAIRGELEASATTARDELLSFLQHDELEVEPVVARDVGIVLASEDFSQEIATTVLWLNEFHDFDIRCVRMAPYVLGEQVLLDVQQVIPLPEASEYTVRVRAKEATTRKTSGTSKTDWTKFVVTTPLATWPPLSKRWAILRLVEGLAAAGVAMSAVHAVLPNNKLLRVSGHFDSADGLWSAVQATWNRSDDNRVRWHLGDPIVEGAYTWVLNNNWGTTFRPTVEKLLELAPEGFDVAAETGD